MDLHHSSSPTQLKDLQGHGEPRLLGPNQRPVAGAEVLTGRQQQHHGYLVPKLQQLTGVHTVLVRLSQTDENLFQAICQTDFYRAFLKNSDRERLEVAAETRVTL